MKATTHLAVQLRHNKLLLVLIIFPIVYAIVISSLFFLRSDSFKFLSSDNLQKSSTLVLSSSSSTPPENMVIPTADSSVYNQDTSYTGTNSFGSEPIDLPPLSDNQENRQYEEYPPNNTEEASPLYFNLDSVEIANNILVAELSQTEDMLELHYKPNQHFPNSHMVYKSLMNKLSTKTQDGVIFKKIIILGFTDNKGSKEENLKICEVRANIIKAIFITNGYPANMIEIGCFADQLPIDTNLTEEGRFRNRRVEINILRNSNQLEAYENR